jgi:hypothetical protein
MRQIVQGVSILIILILLCYLTREFFPRVDTIETVQIDTVWKERTIRKDSIITKLVPKYVYLPSDTVYIPESCDELKRLYLALYSEYFTLNQYSEVLPIDTIGEATIVVCMRANTLDTLGFSYTINLWEKEIKIIERKEPNDWYLYGETNFNTFSLGTIYARKNFVYKATYNINDKSAQIGVGIKIKELWK